MVSGQTVSTREGSVALIGPPTLQGSAIESEKSGLKAAFFVYFIVGVRIQRQHVGQLASAQ